MTLNAVQPAQINSPLLTPVHSFFINVCLGVQMSTCPILFLRTTGVIACVVFEKPY
jgi:hypothetical protein